MSWRQGQVETRDNRKGERRRAIRGPFSVRCDGKSRVGLQFEAAGQGHRRFRGGVFTLCYIDVRKPRCPRGVPGPAVSRGARGRTDRLGYPYPIVARGCGSRLAREPTLVLPFNRTRLPLPGRSHLPRYPAGLAPGERTRPSTLWSCYRGQRRCRSGIRTCTLDQPATLLGSGGTCAGTGVRVFPRTPRPLECGPAACFLQLRVCMVVPFLTRRFHKLVPISRRIWVSQGTSKDVAYR